MNIEKVVITGAKGIIGTVLTQGLGRKYQVTAIDLPEFDLRNLSDVEKALTGQDAVIHL